MARRGRQKRFKNEIRLWNGTYEMFFFHMVVMELRREVSHLDKRFNGHKGHHNFVFNWFKQVYPLASPREDDVTIGG